MAAPEVIDVDQPSDNGSGPGLPRIVKIEGSPRMTPNELRLLKAATGKGLQDLMGDEADAMQAVIWLKVRRTGHDLTWEQAGDIEADLSDEPPDPTNSGSTTTSPTSAASGAAPPGTSTP